MRCLIGTLFFYTFIVTDSETERILLCITTDLDNVVEMEVEIFKVKRYILKVQSEILLHLNELPRVRS